MRYLRVTWKHNDPSEPTELISELDDQNWETRKVEIFADGHLGLADRNRESDSTWLSIEPFPSDDEIRSNPEFSLEVIDVLTFESLWNRACRTAESV